MTQKRLMTYAVSEPFGKSRALMVYRAPKSYRTQVEPP